MARDGPGGGRPYVMGAEAVSEQSSAGMGTQDIALPALPCGWQIESVGTQALPEARCPRFPRS